MDDKAIFTTNEKKYNNWVMKKMFISRLINLKCKIQCLKISKLLNSI